MRNYALITPYKNKIMLAIFLDDSLDFLSFYKEDEELIGTVFLSRVTKVLSNIDSAFINYQHGKNGFLKSKNIKAEQIIPLQLKKEATGNKEPMFSEDITLVSKYVIVSKGIPTINVSSKIEKSKADLLKKKYEHFCSDFNVQIVIRTNALFAEDNEIENDITKKCTELDSILKHSKDRTPYSILYTPPKGYIDELSSLRSDLLDYIITDDTTIFDELEESRQSGLIFKNTDIRYYEDKLLPLFHLYKMDHNIKNSLNRIIPLKSGAEIVIDETEALVAIDVNTHHSTIKKNIEDTFLNTNIEAAKEIMRQLRVRNLSGMIIIDFINMKLQKNYDQLLEVLKEEAKKDPVSVKVIDITGLKLVEVVRTKRRKTLKEQMR